MKLHTLAPSQVVASGEPGNERSVMKNAHEIAILSALSHPNILQVGIGLTCFYSHKLAAMYSAVVDMQFLHVK